MRDRELIVEHVLRCVEQVQAGRVVSYGLVARIVGLGPREVGAIMARHGSDVAWWRITNAAGALPPDLRAQAAAHWQAEGITTAADGARCRIRMHAMPEADLRVAYQRAVAELPAIQTRL